MQLPSAPLAHAYDAEGDWRQIGEPLLRSQLLGSHQQRNASRRIGHRRQAMPHLDDVAGAQQIAAGDLQQVAADEAPDGEQSGGVVGA